MPVAFGHWTFKNYRLHVVPNGAEALAYLQGIETYTDRSAYPSPDFLILDLKMPGTSGFDVLQWLRDHPRCFVIPTVIFTASEMEENVQRAYELGANSYFTKPGSFHELVDLLQMLLKYWTKCKRPLKPPGDHC